MKIKVKNLGVLKQAEFCINDMTIICGKNNTGKTYATYALYGFLSEWRNFIKIKTDEKIVSLLLKDGSVTIDLIEYKNQVSSIISDGCKKYLEFLPVVFAAQEDRFKETSFLIELSPSDINIDRKYTKEFRTADIDLFSLLKKENENMLTITLLQDKDKIRIPPQAIAKTIEDSIAEILFSHLFPNPFIASAERTGAAIFRKELNFDKNRMVEEITKLNSKVDLLDLFMKTYANDYALPVKENVKFTRQLESLSKKNSFIKENHNEILNDFAEIIGGEYTVSKNDELYYVPKGKKGKFTMDESSSAVRSLLDIGFFLRHVAQKGDILMIDEPELNLHPENQRKIARLLSRLVNIGIQVYITTHSDYIIKELNTLIMLKQNKEHIKKIIEAEKYVECELLDAVKINVYVAKRDTILLEETGIRSKVMTFVKSPISQENGIEINSFDDTIDEMNRIQDEIIWGDS